MEHREFLTIIEQVAGVPFEVTDNVACPTLRILARRITTGQAKQIAAHLPVPLRPCLDPEANPEKYHLDGFLQRVADQLDVDSVTAERLALGVFAAIWRAAGPDEFNDLRSELPKDFYPLMDAAAEAVPLPEDEPLFIGGLTHDEFIDRVAEQAGITDRDRVSRAVEAVLEMIGLRISPGQVADLIPMLPLELRAPLRRGNSRSRRGAVPLSPDVFLHDTAKRAGITRQEALKDLRAVFAVLPQAVGDKEYDDVISQLPGEYRPMRKHG
ncbi:DUF2267 domain-containing protein [Actinacidiphila soli]|jgi:uncharacterized protein (DUF2267 family)|uniref:DUF2267 domain-containing protein n=1 Tax=Actinacidiphila soli TaxID=2487275 RepID=UPI000FCACEC7|nr:DUF2267 domain-containing protein [Actinacidiphila soli]